MIMAFEMKMAIATTGKRKITIMKKKVKKKSNLLQGKDISSKRT